MQTGRKKKMEEGEGQEKALAAIHRSSPTAFMLRKSNWALDKKKSQEKEKNQHIELVSAPQEKGNSKKAKGNG